MDTTTATPLILATTTSSSSSTVDYHPRALKPDDLSQQLISVNQPKKCIHHNLMHYSRPLSQQQQQQQQQPQQQQHHFVGIGSSNNSDVDGSSGSGSGNATTGGASTTVTQSSAMQIDLTNPSESRQGYGGLLAKRYLVWDLFDGNSVHKCYDVKTLEELVCKAACNAS